MINNDIIETFDPKAPVIYTHTHAGILVFYEKSFDFLSIEK